MPRQRKNKKDQWMPPRVYRGKSAFEWHPKSGGAIKLAPLTATHAEVWTAYEEHFNTAGGKGSFQKLVNEYLNSDKLKSLSVSTQKDYFKSSKMVLSVFSNMQSNKISPQDVFKYHEIRSKKAKVRANREKSFMSVVFNWGIPRGKCNSNPCAFVPNNKEQARTRYITDEEYQAVYSEACNVVKIAMEISYLCMARQSDVLNMTAKQIKTEGVYIKQGKTGKKQIKRWGERLKAAYQLSLKLESYISSIYVIHQPNGLRFAGRTFQGRWAEARNKAEQKAKDIDPDSRFDFTFHDIKAKAISDFEGTDSEKQNSSGHKTLSQVHTYNRKAQIVDTVETKNKNN